MNTTWTASTHLSESNFVEFIIVFFFVLAHSHAFARGIGQNSLTGAQLAIEKKKKNRERNSFIFVSFICDIYLLKRREQSSPHPLGTHDARAERQIHNEIIARFKMQ